MKKTLLGLALLATAIPFAAHSTNDKLDATLQRLLNQSHPTRSSANAKLPRSIRALGRISADGLVGLFVESRDAAATADFLRRMGGQASVLNERFLSARVHYSLLTELAARTEVQRVSVAQQLRTQLKRAHESSGVRRIHQGESLSTPFTGKGVVLGVIDQGFEFQHLAFRSKDRSQSRLRAVWDRTEEDSQATTDIPTGGDDQGHGHGTHVAAIAAGTEVIQGLGGVAPDAELIFVPSSLGSEEVAQDVQFIKEFAEKEGKRWVVNMSFGSQMGPHDGSQPFDQEVSALLGTQGFITASMGNDGGEAIHASATLQPGQTRYLVINMPEPDDEEIGAEEDESGEDQAGALLDFWASSTDSVSHFQIGKQVYTTNLRTLSQTQWKRIGAEDAEEINAYNRKQNFTIYCPTKGLREVTRNDSARLVLRITLPASAKQAETFHAWLNSSNGTFHNAALPTIGSKTIAGDDRYLVGEGSATIPRAFAVGSYTTSTSIRSLVDGQERTFTPDVFPIGLVGERSTFSNVGPYLADAPKPLLLAPGAMIESAVSKEYTGFSTQSTWLTQRVEHEGEPYYYSAMAGTSMSSPYFAGTLALWLEAHPQLSYEQVIDVVRQSSRRPDGAAPFSTEVGYGQLDAYEGLKAVLRLAKLDGINRASNSLTPITLQRSADVWRILFNNAESEAEIRIFNAAGQLLDSQQLGAQAQGSEHRLELSQLPQGVLLVSVRTARTQQTFRLLR